MIPKPGFMYFTETTRKRNIAKDPAVIKWDGQYYLYYSAPSAPKHNALDWRIGIAVSNDLINWSKVGEVNIDGEAEQNGVGAPGAIILDGVIHLFFQTYGNGPMDAICHAWSTDGIHFTHNPTNPIFRPTGDWNNGRAIDADVVVWDNHLYLYYATRDPENITQIQGVARAPLGGDYLREDWEQLGDGPLMIPELPWEGECVEAAATIVKNDKIYMFYGAAYNNWPQQVGVAVSEDGINFTRLFVDGPFLKNGEPGSWNSSESGHPYVFEDDDGRVYLFYQGNDDMGETWFISQREVTFDEQGPNLVPFA